MCHFICVVISHYRGWSNSVLCLLAQDTILKHQDILTSYDPRLQLPDGWRKSDKFLKVAGYLAKLQCEGRLLYDMADQKQGLPETLCRLLGRALNDITTARMRAHTQNRPPFIIVFFEAEISQADKVLLKSIKRESNKGAKVGAPKKIAAPAKKSESKNSASGNLLTWTHFTPKKGTYMVPYIYVLNDVI